MPASSEQLQPIVPADLFAAAQEVIQRTKQETPYPLLLDAKLGDADTGPLTDAQLASAHDTSLSTLNRRAAYAIEALVRTDQEFGCPLGGVVKTVRGW